MKLFNLPPALLAFVASFVGPAVAQFPPPSSFPHSLASPVDPNITVSYKQPTPGTCQTVYSTQKQYTGYIRMAPNTLAPIQQNYSMNYFFWFIEARQAPSAAPLTVYINGGPGSSSMVGLFNEVGPCEVVQTGDGTYGTQYRLWGWDRSSNILFIDQPNQVGFSYDTPINATYNFFTADTFETPSVATELLPSYMLKNGTFGSAGNGGSDPWTASANTTEIAAHAVWHFLQAWLSAFPRYNPATRPNVTSSTYAPNVPAGINLFAESYGGKYGSVFATFFEQQNSAIQNGTLPKNSTIPIVLESVGIINGLVDDLIQDYYYPFFAYNNTYGISAISQVQELNEINYFNTQCSTQIQACRAAMANTEADGYGDNASTNELCEQAQYACNFLVADYIANGYYVYDIRQRLPSPDPPAAYQEYLNTAMVQASIGAEVNYTESNRHVQTGFISTGDTIRGGMIEDLAYLLSNNIRVALIYGDSDYICNWFGGEAVSLAVADQLPNYPISTIPGVAAPVPYAAGFPSAGYADIVVNSTYVGGVVRQYGNLSFSRIYNAGHFVGYFQPETAFTIFTRIIQGTSLSTGEDVDLSTFGSTGPANATYTTSATYSPTPTCWVRAWNQSCSELDTAALFDGSGMDEYGRFFLSSIDTSSVLPSATVHVGRPGHPLPTGDAETAGGTGTQGAQPTGVYTATGTPTKSGRASSDLRVPPLTHVSWASLLVLFGCFLGGFVMLW